MAKNCLKQENAEKIPIGQCAANTGQNGCTLVKEACQLPKSFVTPSPVCMICVHLSTDSCYKGNAHFGSCNTIMRRWVFLRIGVIGERNADTSQELAWMPALQGNPTKSNDCTCNLLQTGTCQFQREVYCTVSAKSCDRRSH